jgi:methyl-accepting chemotaxis protein
MVAEQTNGLNLNMGALGGAAMGVGGALGLLSSLMASLGFEEEAEVVGTLAAVFMGLGSVMTLLSTIAPMLGMSFTTAGVQITVAGVTSQLAWWWVFLIIAAIALLVVGVLALAKAAKEASDEYQLEKLNEQIDDLGNAADEAKEKLEDMAASRKELEELGDTFNGLVKGSREWKKALIENNQKVLDLLNTYPELAKYVSKGLNGEMTISDEGWDTIMDK